MALCWGEGHGSSVHDHSGSHCFVKVLEGNLQETVFDWPSESDPDSPLQETRRVVLGKDEVTYMSGKMSAYTYILYLLREYTSYLIDMFFSQYTTYNFDI